MNQVTKMTTNVSEIASATEGMWGIEKVRNQDCIYAIVGRVVFVEGDHTKCPISVMSWHVDSNGAWGIIGR